MEHGAGRLGRGDRKREKGEGILGIEDYRLLQVAKMISLVTDDNYSYISSMNLKKDLGLDFIVDKLTNSIENVVTGDSFATEISILTAIDLKTATNKNGWLFNWKEEFKVPARDVYKLTIVNNPTIIQGLISLEVKIDHVYIHLIESAPFNKGNTKMYSGVPGNLVAFACKLSFQRGHEGNVSFLSKTQLVDHYIKSLGAFHFGGRVMVIETQAALKLINKYFQGI
jgi:hypothetical protein